MNYPTAPAYSIHGKKASIGALNPGYTDASPGPIYNTFGKGIKVRAKSHTIGTSTRTNINHGVSTNPGPTHYVSAHPKKSSIISFSKSNKDNPQMNDPSPDPASYDPLLRYVKERAPKYQIGSKYPTVIDTVNCNPGPGEYNNTKTSFQNLINNQKLSVLSKASRFSASDISLPGPSDYTTTTLYKQSFQKKGTLSKALRFSNSVKISPGPGQYIQSQGVAKCVRVSGKTMGFALNTCFQEKVETKESFNNYFRQEVCPKSQKTYSMGKQKRQIFRTLDIPGPADYNADKIEKNKKNAIMPRSGRSKNQLSEHTPCPGEYYPVRPKTTEYSMPKSRSVGTINANPGVGRYDIAKRSEFSSGSKWMIGKSQRTNFISKSTRGVGDYQILQKKIGGVSIPKARRFQICNRNPGPGAYHIHSTISNFTSHKKCK